MTYGLFNLATGNLIDSVDSEPDALELLTALLEEKDSDVEALGLVVADDAGHTLAVLQGHALTDAVYNGGIEAAVYA